jgi:hypothetical protein
MRRTHYTPPTTTVECPVCHVGWIDVWVETSGPPPMMRKIVSIDATCYCVESDLVDEDMYEEALERSL